LKSKIITKKNLLPELVFNEEFLTSIAAKALAKTVGGIDVVKIKPEP